MLACKFAWLFLMFYRELVRTVPVISDMNWQTFLHPCCPVTQRAEPVTGVWSSDTPATSQWAQAAVQHSYPLLTAMVHRTRSGQQQAVSKVSVMSMGPPPPPMYGHTGHTPGNTGHMASDGTLLTMCQCNTFLDPYPSGQSVQWR